MIVRLTKKLADVVNGVDISRYIEGDVIELPTRSGEMLVAEGWAEDIAPAAMSKASPYAGGWRPDARAVAADRPVPQPGNESEQDELIRRLSRGVSPSWRGRIDSDPEPSM